MLARPSFIGFVLIVLGLAIAGGVGTYIAPVIPMTSMPQLVAGFHSLVGLAAVLVAASALYMSLSFGIGYIGTIHTEARVEMAIGAAIGALTFTGSIIAFLKFDGRMSGNLMFECAAVLRHVHPPPRSWRLNFGEQFNCLGLFLTKIVREDDAT